MNASTGYQNGSGPTTAHRALARHGPEDLAIGPARGGPGVQHEPSLHTTLGVQDEPLGCGRRAIPASQPYRPVLADPRVLDGKLEGREIHGLAHGQRNGPPVLGGRRAGAVGDHAARLAAARPLRDGIQAGIGVGIRAISELPMIDGVPAQAEAGHFDGTLVGRYGHRRFHGYVAIQQRLPPRHGGRRTGRHQAPPRHRHIVVFGVDPPVTSPR